MKEANKLNNSILQADMDYLVESCRYDSELQGTSILITGATGLIARYLTTFLLEMNRQKNMGIKVYALIRNRKKAEAAFASYIEDSNFHMIAQDICEPIKLDSGVEYVFHAAGSASASAIRSNPTGIIEANTRGTLNVLKYSVANNVSKVVFTSTREIYGRVEGTEPIAEDTMGTLNPLESRNCYPESKRAAEAMLEGYYQQYGLNYNVLRIAHTYGPTMGLINDGRVMADLIEAVVNRHNIVLNSDGTAVRAFCYVTDTIRGILDVMFRGEDAEAYNLANETEPTAIRDVAEKLIEMFPKRGVKLEFSNPDDSVKKGYLGYKIIPMDTGKLERLGWKPETSLVEGMEKTVEYFIVNDM